MLINQPMTREMWRKLVVSFREASAVKYVPEYHEPHERSMNHRYYR